MCSSPPKVTVTEHLLIMNVLISFAYNKIFPLIRKLVYYFMKITTGKRYGEDIVFYSAIYRLQSCNSIIHRFYILK